MSKARVGMVTVGQAPRGDVVPDMAALLPGVEILEAGALDGLDGAAIARLAPTGDDEILVTRLADASSVFVGKSHVLPRAERHVPQTTARWRADGFDAAVVPLSPYEEHDPASLARATAALRAAEAGLVVMDCIGFRDVTRRDLTVRLGVPVLVANLLVARLAAELLAL